MQFRELMWILEDDYTGCQTPRGTVATRESMVPYCHMCLLNKQKVWKYEDWETHERKQNRFIICHTLEKHLRLKALSYYLYLLPAIRHLWQKNQNLNPEFQCVIWWFGGQICDLSRINNLNVHPGENIRWRQRQGTAQWQLTKIVYEKMSHSVR